MEVEQTSMWDMTVRDLFRSCRESNDGEGVMMSRLMRGNREPIGAIILVTGSEETTEVLDSVNGQLEIWKREQKPARYVDEKERIVSVSLVRGFGYSVVVHSPQTGGIEILRAREVTPSRATFAEAQTSLDAFAEKKNWSRIPEPQSVLDALSLVMTNPPGVKRIASWSDLDRVRATQWALLTHVRASDNPTVRVPSVPNVLFDYVRGAA